MSSPNLRSAGRAKSCTRCRQAKVACDARKNLNGPCSRCRLKKLNCRFDANFKRISTRRLTEEISDDLHALRSAEEPSQANHFSQKSAPNLQIVPDNANTEVSVEPVSNMREHALSWLSIADSDEACSYNLGTLKLEARTAIELFQYFNVHYHGYAMFLQPVNSLSDLLTRSPLLFWSIILAASQEQDRFAGIYCEVANEHEGLLSTVLQKAIRQIETIHALLLLCLWPIPRPHYFDNPAWNYAGLATNAAIQLQCHCPMDYGDEQNAWPGFSPRAEGEVDMADRARTWLGCFRVGTAVATFSGLPPLISMQQHMGSIDKALQTISDVVPPWWTTMFSILKIMNLAVDALCNIVDPTLHFSVTQMFGEQLTELKQMNLVLWRLELEIEWCNAKLYLFGLIFTTGVNTDLSQTTQLRIYRQSILHKAFEAASSLITQYMSLGQLDVSDLHPSGLLKFVPELYFTSLFNATTFLFRFMATVKPLAPAQASQSMGLIIEAHKIFQSYPDHREFTRAAIHIETLIEILKQGAPAGMSELVVKNKLGASVMFDAVFHACRQRNIDPSSGRPLAVHEWRTVSETFAERLPGPPAQNMRTDNQVFSFENDVPELGRPSLGFVEDNLEWWGEWDRYIDLFQVGEELLDIDL